MSYEFRSLFALVVYLIFILSAARSRPYAFRIPLGYGRCIYALDKSLQKSNARNSVPSIIMSLDGVPRKTGDEIIIASRFRYDTVKRAKNLLRSSTDSLNPK